MNMSSDYNRARRIAGHARLGMVVYPARPGTVDPDLIRWQDEGAVGDFETYKTNVERQRANERQRNAEDCERMLREDAEQMERHMRGEGPAPLVRW
jgi:hypothetical protein